MVPEKVVSKIANEIAERIDRSIEEKTFPTEIENILRSLVGAKDAIEIAAEVGRKIVEKLRFGGTWKNSQLLDALQKIIDFLEEAPEGPSTLAEQG